MNIVFATQGNWEWESKIDRNFGKAHSFLRYNEENEKIWWISNNDCSKSDLDCGIQSGKRVIGLKADVLITGGYIEMKALEILKKENLKIYSNVGDMTIQRAYDAYKHGKLEAYKI